MDKILSLLQGNCYKKEDEDGNVSYWRFMDGKEEKISAKEIEDVRASQAFLAILKREAISEINGLADYYHNLISQASPQKMARYEAKYQMAITHKMGQSTETEKTLLQAEALERGLTLEQHVEAILAAHRYLTHAAAQIEVFQAKTKKAMEKALSPSDIEKLQKEFTQEAKKLLENQTASSDAPQKTQDASQSLTEKTKRIFLQLSKKNKA